jgi:uncharacterized protein (TIGR02246 family)
MSSTSIATSAPDETAVRAVIDGVYAAWAENDAQAFVAGYAEEATAQLPGTYLRDRETVRSCMEAEFAGRLRGTRATHDVVSVRLISPDVAIVIGRAAVVMSGQSEAVPETSSLDTWVLSRRGGTWRVEAYQGSPEHAG